MKPCKSDVMGTDPTDSERMTRCQTCLIVACALRLSPRGVTSALDVQVAGDHYRTMKIQPVEFITANNLGFLEGCVIKRVCRYRAKAGAQDLRKAIHELQLLLELHYPGDAS